MRPGTAIWVQSACPWSYSSDRHRKNSFINPHNNNSQMPNDAMPLTFYIEHLWSCLFPQNLSRRRWKFTGTYQWLRQWTSFLFCDPSLPYVEVNIYILNLFTMLTQRQNQTFWLFKHLFIYYFKIFKARGGGRATTKMNKQTNKTKLWESHHKGNVREWDVPLWSVHPQQLSPV